MDLSSSSNSSHIKPILDSVDDLFLLQHVCNPTRFRQAVSLSLLHLVFTSEKDMVANPSYLLPLGNSDHICLQFSVLCYSEYDVSNNIRYNIGAANIDMMKEAIGNIDWESILDPLDTNDAWLLFKCIMQNLIDKHVPTCRPKERKNWYTTPEVFNLKKNNKLWKKHRSTRSPRDLSNFKSTNNELRNLTRTLRRNYEHHLV